MDLIIKVPVKHHIRDYLEDYYATQNQPAPLRKNDVIGSYLMNLLERPDFFYRYEMDPEVYTSFSFTINKWNTKHIGFSLPEEKVIEFNNWVETLIRHEFVAFVDSKTEADVLNKETFNHFEIREAIINYLSRRNLSEQKCLNYEQLKKHYYRQRKRRDNRRTKVHVSDLDLQKLGTAKRLEYSLVLLREIDPTTISRTSWEKYKYGIRKSVNETLRRSPSRKAIANYLWEKIDKYFREKVADFCHG